MKTVRDLMQEIENLKGEVVRVFGQPYTIPSEPTCMLVDVVDIMSAWDGYESDLTISRLDYDLINELEEKIEEVEEEIDSLFEDEEERLEELEIELDALRGELEDVYDNYIEEEVEDIDDYLDFLEEMYGLEDRYKGNTYNQGGNITHDYYEHHYDCGDGYHYVRVAIHRFGDVRANYTDEVLLRFESEYESYEIMSENDYLTEIVEINGEEYDLCIRGRYEDIEVFGAYDGKYVCTIYGAMTKDEAREEIAKKLGIELVA